MKKQILLTFCLFLILIFNFLWANTKLQIKVVEGLNIKKTELMLIQGMGYLKAADVAKIFKADLSYGSELKTVIFKFEKQNIIFEENANFVVINSKKINFKKKTKILDGDFYIPLAFVLSKYFRKASGYKVSWNYDKKTLKLRAKKNTDKVEVKIPSSNVLNKAKVPLPRDQIRMEKDGFVLKEDFDGVGCDINKLFENLIKEEIIKESGFIFGNVEYIKSDFMGLSKNKINLIKAILQKSKVKKINPTNEKKVNNLRKKNDFRKNLKFEGKKLYIYKDTGFKENNYIPTGWMGDYGDLKLSTRSFMKPKKGVSCIKISYSAEKSQQVGWAGIYWQSTGNNWALEKTGANLIGAKKLVFYIRGQRGGEIIDGFKIGGISGTYPDTADISYGPIILTQNWEKYSIDLRDYDLSHNIGGFAFILMSETNPAGMVFYLDEIYFA